VNCDFARSERLLKLGKAIDIHSPPAKQQERVFAHLTENKIKFWGLTGSLVGLFFISVQRY